MLLKIFAKKLGGGEYPEGHNYDTYVEADKFVKTIEKDIVEFAFVPDRVHAPEDVKIERVNLKTHGYEIFTDKGVSVEKYLWFKQ